MDKLRELNSPYYIPLTELDYELEDKKVIVGLNYILTEPRAEPLNPRIFYKISDDIYVINIPKPLHKYVDIFIDVAKDKIYVSDGYCMFDYFISRPTIIGLAKDVNSSYLHTKITKQLKPIIEALNLIK